MSEIYGSTQTSCISSNTGKHSFTRTNNTRNSLHTNDRSMHLLKVYEENFSQPVLNDTSETVSEGEYEPALANWNKWLKIHKKQQNKLSHQVKRHPQCLIMNTTLHDIPVNQEKKLITEAENIIFCDKYRGHPHFWVTDNSLKHDGMALGVYQTIQQKYNRSSLERQQNVCLMPEQRQYIGIPEAILKEKGISEKPCLPTPQENWDRSKYLVEKREFLKEKIKLIQEHKPNVSDLAVIGMPVGHSSLPGESEILSEKTASSPSTCSSISNFKKIRKPILVMIEEKEVEESDDPWTVCFENCVINEILNINMVIKNKKTSSLRYSWALEMPRWVSSDWPMKCLKNQGKCFYFDKNDGVILPGCEHKVIIYFQSFKPGVFCESWKLNLSHEPDEWDTKAIELLAVAVERQDCTVNIESIDSYIESCTRYTIARKAVEEILDKSRSQKQIQSLPYNWKFFEEQIFLHNNPDLFYDNKCVRVLKDLHAKISEGPWDYSVNNLRRELFNKFVNKICSEELEIFSSTIYQLLKPTLPTCLLNEKQKSVYELLRCFVNKMDLESAKLMVIYKLPISLNYSEGTSQIQKKPTNIFKLSAKSNLLSKNLSKHSSKRSTIKNGSNNTGDNNFASKTQSSYSDSISSLKIKTRKQEYLETMYIKTYHHLSQTIDHISAIIESFDAQSKKTALNHIRDHLA